MKEQFSRRETAMAVGLVFVVCGMMLTGQFRSWMAHMDDEDAHPKAAVKQLERDVAAIQAQMKEQANQARADAERASRDANFKAMRESQERTLAEVGRVVAESNRAIGKMLADVVRELHGPGRKETTR